MAQCEALYLRCEVWFIRGSGTHGDSFLPDGEGPAADQQHDVPEERRALQRDDRPIV